LKKSRVVRIGNRKIGGGNPVLVQSMCNTKTTDIDSTLKQIHELQDSGCEIIRLAVPDEKSASALKEIKQNIDIPLVADIHFDYRLAVLSSKYCDKIRINPGNIGSDKHVRSVLDAAKENSIPIRIGVNLGSLHKKIEEKYGRTPDAMVESALQHIRFCEKNDFNEIVISLKASDVMTTIQANRLFSERSDYPLHIGVTEAGTMFDGTIRSSVGIGTLLADNIGDTIRVSLTENPVEEIRVSYSILSSLGLRKTGRTIISCPTCGRTHGDLIRIAKEIEERTEHIKKPITIAVMGCEVNGPGEAKHADIGVALSRDNVHIFKKGRIIKEVSKTDLVDCLIDEINNL